MLMTWKKVGVRLEVHILKIIMHFSRLTVRLLPNNFLSTMTIMIIIMGLTPPSLACQIQYKLRDIILCRIVQHMARVRPVPLYINE